MKISRIIYPVLLIIWMIIIFLFSNQTANESQSVSDGFTNKIVNIIEFVSKKKVSVDNISFIVRKTAHFTIYFILGILIFLTLTSYDVSKPVLYGILFCFLYAISDEVHQIFVSGRGPRVLDVLIDTVGSITSIIILSKFMRN